MSERRLTDEQLDKIEETAKRATDGVELYLKWDGSIVECGTGGRFEPTEFDVELYMHAKHYLAEVIAELRDLRGLLATPMRDNWPAPHVDAHPQLGMLGVYVTGGFAMPDEALALGAAIFRTALQAKGGAK